VAHPELDPHQRLSVTFREEELASLTDVEIEQVNGVIETWDNEDLVGTLDAALLDLERRVRAALKGGR
jgi:hypothetical protein